MYFKRISFICVSLSLHALLVNGQQRPHYSQYMMNQYLINPAVGGTSDHYDFRVGHREQWTGIDGIKDSRPQTSYLSGHFHIGQHIGPNRGRHKNEVDWHHGFGGMVILDKTGPTSRTSAYASYSYNAAITKKVKISFGAALGFQQYRLDGSQLKFSDQSTGTASSVEWMPDMNLGYWLYHPRYFFGATINQIFQNKLKFTEISPDGNNKLNNHYFVTGGYLIGYNTDLHLIPSVMIKMVSPAPISFDINCKAKYKETVWLGVSYRREDAIVFLAGVSVKHLIDIGYSYDYGTSALSKLSSGSHEIMLGLKLAPKAELRSPSDFW